MIQELRSLHFLVLYYENRLLYEYNIYLVPGTLYVQVMYYFIPWWTTNAAVDLASNIAT